MSTYHMIYKFWQFIILVSDIHDKSHDDLKKFPGNTFDKLFKDG